MLRVLVFAMARSRACALVAKAAQANTDARIANGFWRGAVGPHHNFDIGQTAQNTARSAKKMGVSLVLCCLLGGAKTPHPVARIVARQEPGAHKIVEVSKDARAVREPAEGVDDLRVGHRRRRSAKKLHHRHAPRRDLQAPGSKLVAEGLRV